MITEAEALDKSHTDLARRLADAGRKAESDAKVIAALREALAPFAASAYDRDGLPPDWEIGTPLCHLRVARSAIAAADGQEAGE
jgi:hypothetical protein